VLRDFNLLATTSRGNEREACTELTFLFKEVGDSAATIERTGVAGLIATKTSLDPFGTVEKLRKILVERPYEFRYTLRIIPIEKVVCTDLEEIRQAATELSLKIGENETFRVTVEKRFTAIHAQSIIEAAAANIKKKVKLTKPDKILLIEVVGGLTGMSIVKPDDVLSVMREKIL
jgi:tRNA acetyltransferase TAN1